MKILNKLLIVAICMGLCFSCSEKEEIDSFVPEEDVNLKSLTVLNVPPSGDLTGVSDANNIEAALNLVKSTGGMVYLTDGDENTVDNYYSSKNIVSDGFSGTLKGEGMNRTIIHAGRKSSSQGFESAYAPWWAELTEYSSLPIVLQIDNAVGDVAITDFSIIIKDKHPTNTQSNFYGEPSTYMQSFIEILGGEHNTIIKNIKLEGKESTADGNYRGMNVESGIHVMLGPPNVFPSKTGTLIVKNVDVENTGGDALLFMRFQEGSSITVDKVKAINVKRGIYAGGVFNSSVKISNMDILVHPLGFQGIAVWSMPSGLQIMHNTIKQSKYYGIILWPGTDNAAVFDNKFIDIGNNWAGILVRGNGNSIFRNDYKKSNLPGWTADAPDGPGAIVLTGTTNGNYIHEMKFPNGKSKTLCEMILDLTDDVLTPEYDGLNEIHNYRPCENLSKRDARFEEMGLDRHRF